MLIWSDPGKQDGKCRHIGFRDGSGWKIVCALSENTILEIRDFTQ